jgi:hypothetical protein
VAASQLPISTPEGARALRQIACSAAWTEDDPREARRWLGPAITAQLPAARAEAAAQLTPATRGDFKRTVAPTLSLVAPASMSENDQTAWLATAAETLSGIPADLLERGCLAARRKIDHPSKIVAAIFAEIGDVWERRKRDLRGVDRLAVLASSPAEPPRPWERDGDEIAPHDRCSPEEAARILDELNLRVDRPQEPDRHRGPPRMPTAEETAQLMREMGLSA